MLVNIIIGVIVLHLLVGFGWVVYKLSGKKGEGLIDSSDWENEEKSI